VTRGELALVGEEPDAEVRQPRRTALRRDPLDEDVARLDVLVQHADRVRRGGGVGDLR
jgi:hypothetical protein